MKLDELTAKETELIELLRAHLVLVETVGEVLAVVGGESTGPGTADAAEARLVEPLRTLGLKVLGSWAQRGERLAGERLQAGDSHARIRAKKKSRGTASTARSR